MVNSISIVIPAYNEEKRIVSSISKIIDYLEKESEKYGDYEIIVVDDGSKDNTIAEVENIKDKHLRIISNGRNKGKGFSVKNGVLNSSKDYVLFSDADLSTPIEELDKLMEHISKYHVVIGSRRMKSSNIIVKQPWYRRLPGKIFPLIVNLLILQGIKDTQCGFKLFRKEVAQRLFKMQKLERFSFDAEILLLAKKHRLLIKEVPVVWKNALDSKLNPIKDSLSMFIELLKIRYNILLGNYKDDKELKKIAKN